MSAWWMAVGDYDPHDPDHRVGQEVLVTQPARRTWQLRTHIAFYTKEPLGRVWEMLEVMELPVYDPQLVAGLPWATPEKGRRWAWVRAAESCCAACRAFRLPGSSRTLTSLHPDVAPFAPEPSS